MNLKLKPNFKNTIVIRGNYIFNADQIPEFQYEFFYNNGFSDLFIKPTVAKPKEEAPEKPKLTNYKGVKNNKKK